MPSVSAQPLPQPTAVVEAGSSAVSGRVTASGQPVAGALVVATRAVKDQSLSELPCDCPGMRGHNLLDECLCAEATEQLPSLVSERHGEVVPVGRVRTGSDGAFAFDGLEAGTVALWVDDEGHGVAFQPDVAVGTRGLQLELSSGMTLRGTTNLDIDGTPAAGAWVTLVHAGHSRFFDTVSDDDGGFAIGPVPRGDYAIVAGREGCMTAHAFVSAWDEAHPVVLPVWAKSRLEGTVVGKEGRVSGAAVRLTDGEHDYETVSKPDGTFVFTQIWPGEYELTAMAGERWGHTELDVPATEPVEVRLERGAAVRGRITHGDRPLAGALVRLEQASTRSDARGEYRLVGEFGHDLTFSVQLRGYAGHKQLLDLARGVRVLDVELGPEAIVQGTVVEEGSGVPVNDAQVSAGCGEVESEATSNREGAFTLEGLGKASCTVSVRHQGHLPFETQVSAPSTNVRLSLAPALTVNGDVVTAGGQGIAADVFASPIRNEHELTTGQATDAGVFSLPGLFPGPYKFEARTADGSMGATTARLPLPEAARVRIVITRTLTISGKVVDPQGRPVSGARVSAYPLDGGFIAMWDPTDETGDFVIRAVEATDYDLWAFDDPSRHEKPRMMRVRGGQSGVRYVIEPPLTIRGRAVDAHKAPIKRFIVNSETFEGADGRFDVTVGSGTKKLFFTTADCISVERDLPEQARGVVELGEVVLCDGRELTVHVRSKETGEPVEGASVAVAGTYAGSTDERGVLALRGVAAADVHLEVWRRDYQSQAEEVTASEREKTVMLEKGGGLAVTLLAPSGVPAGGTVSLYCPARKYFEPARTTESNGRRWIGALEPGTWLVLGASPRGGRAHTLVTLGANQEKEVTLTLPEGRTHVIVALAPGPAPWTPTGVSLVPAAAAKLLGDMLRYLPQSYALLGTDTDAPLERELSNVAAGDYVALIQLADGDALAWSAVPVRVPEGVAELRLGPLTGAPVRYQHQE